VETRAGENVGGRTKIEVDYMARVEGEAALVVELDGEPFLELKIFEPPRFFEGFLVGRKYDEVGDIVSRICGICPVSHMITAILAVEKATGIEVSEQTVTLRRLMSLSQIVASHLVHLYVLAMPDYYGYPGIVGMSGQLGDRVLRMLRMKEMMNKLTGIIGGRALHPVTALPGGFTAIPKPQEFADVLEGLMSIRDDAGQVVRDTADFAVPDFHAPCEHVALDAEERYAIDGDAIVSDKGLSITVDQYGEHFHEAEVPYVFAKKSVVGDHNTIRVGALARLNNKFDKLQERTKSVAREVGFSPPDDNPFRNNLAQSLEIVDGIEQCIQVLESTSFEDEELFARPEAGEGGAITEAPRGLLHHWYKVDRQGVVEDANIVTPTAHNFVVIERDLKELVTQHRDLDAPKLKLLCEQLVRAYDPCFSCSVH
jgi:sulfhydrogenase subunit alpha